MFVRVASDQFKPGPRGVVAGDARTKTKVDTGFVAETMAGEMGPHAIWRKRAGGYRWLCGYLPEFGDLECALAAIVRIAVAQSRTKESLEVARRRTGLCR